MHFPRYLAGLFTLTMVAACPSDDTGGELGTEMGTGSDTQSETTTETETGDPCTPPGVFGDCGGAQGTDACLSEGGPDQCVVDDPSTPSIAVCGRPCTALCDCWAAPADGDAPVACISLAPGDDGTCVLDCSNDEACPTGMQCTDLPTGDKLCVFTQ